MVQFYLPQALRWGGVMMLVDVNMKGGRSATLISMIKRVKPHTTYVLLGSV